MVVSSALIIVNQFKLSKHVLSWLTVIMVNCSCLIVIKMLIKTFHICLILVKHEIMVSYWYGLWFALIMVSYLTYKTCLIMVNQNELTSK